MQVIGIAGKAGHGKNMVAEILKETCPAMDFQIVAYATKVKEVYTSITGEAFVDSLDWKNKYLPEWDMTRREMLQKIGTDCMRDGLHPDVWVKALFATLEPGRNYLITDVRFPNEVEAITNAGGRVIRVVRPGYDNATPAHVSETSLDDWDMWCLNNSGSVEELREQVFLYACANNFFE